MRKRITDMISGKFSSGRLLIAVIVILCVVIFGTLYIYEQKSQPVLKPILSSERVPNESAEPQTNYGEEPLSVEPEASQPEKIKVYIAGEVVNPGVYAMDPDDRVEDLIKKAGGQTELADMLAVNLAAHLEDAQKIIVPAQGENVDKYGSEAQNSVEESSLININLADSTQLTALPGIGEVIAGNIIKYREENGVFSSIEEIKKVPRIGTVTYENIKDLITVE